MIYQIYQIYLVLNKSLAMTTAQTYCNVMAILNLDYYHPDLKSSIETYELGWITHASAEHRIIQTKLQKLISTHSTLQQIFLSMYLILIIRELFIFTTDGFLDSKTNAKSTSRWLLSPLHVAYSVGRSDG